MLGKETARFRGRPLFQNWIKTPTISQCCIHTYTNRPSEERFNGRELFFLSAVLPPNPKPLFSLMKHFFTLIAAVMTFMVSGWSQTVVDIVVDSEDHTVLEAAVVEAACGDSARGRTVHRVCTHRRRVHRLPDRTWWEVADLLGLPQLGDILTYHAAGVEAMSTDLSDGQMVTTHKPKTSPFPSWGTL